MSAIERTMVAGNILDRLDALEAKLRDVLDNALTPQDAGQIPEQPDWSTLSGWVITGTEFRDVYGRIVLDATVPSITIAPSGYMQSSNYVAATSGWQINGGTAEFNDVVVRGTIYASVGAIGGWTIGAATLTGGAATLNSAGYLTLGTGNDIARLDAADAAYRLWIGNAAAASAPFSVTKAGALAATGATISGTITATLGAIGGWTIAATTLTGGNVTLNSTGYMTLGTGNDIARLDATDATYRLWIGNATAASAPFRVSKAGALAATGATISGTITATLGAIGGWTIAATTLTGGNVTLNSTGYMTLGTGNDIARLDATDATYRLWIGNAAAASAPFSVTKAGVMSATGATISGTITATLGAIGGWTIAATTLTGGNVTLNSTGYMTLGTGNDIARLDATDATYRLWIGNATAASAPFRVSKAGVLTAVGATIQSATSGARIELSGSGIKGYDATTQRYQISNDGSGWLGDLTVFSWTAAGVVTLNGSAVMPNTILGGKVNFFNVPIIDGLVITNNSPTAGKVAWSAFTLSYQGTSYAVSAGNTSSATYKFIWWNKATSTTVLQAAATPPVQAVDQFIVIFNEAGVGVASLFSNIVYADYISVVNLAAVSANMGALTVDNMLTMATGGVLKSGATAYNTGTGYWLEHNAGTPRLFIGNSTGNKLTWDGTNLNITGRVVIGGSNANYGVNVGEALLACRFDGPCPCETDYTGNPNGHKGQIATVTGGVIYRPGKFGKAVQTAEATTNLATNPSFEADLTGWTKYTGAGTDTRVAGGVIGSYCMELLGLVGVYAGPVQAAGAWYTMSVYLKIVSGQVSFGNFNVAGATLVVTAAQNGNVWTRYSLSWTSVADPPDSIHFITTAGSDVYVDAVQLEAAAYTTPYCDGNLGTGHAWTGTGNASTSTRTAAYLTYPTTQIPAVGSVSAWVSTSALMSQNGNYRWICDAGYTSGVLVYITSFDNLAAYCGGNITTNYALTDANFAPNTWHHVVFTWDVSGTVLYLDGVAVATGAYTAPTDDADGWDIGHRAVATPYIWPGKIDDFFFLGRALSADEVYAVYTSNVPVTVETNVNELRLAGTNTGQVWGHAGGLFGESAAGDAAFGLFTATPAADWGGFTAANIGAGDVILGHNKTGSAAIWWDKSTGKFQFLGNGSSTVQVEVGTDGVFSAGGGTVRLSSSGITIAPGTGIANAIIWPVPSAHNAVTVYGDFTTPVNTLYMSANSSGGGATSYGQVTLQAEGAPSCGIFLYAGHGAVDRVMLLYGDVRMSNGLYVGSVVTDPDDNDIWCDGLISTDGGTTKWELGGYTVTAPVADGYILVTINGAQYKLLCDKV